jgi:hypothetical protein
MLLCFVTRSLKYYVKKKKTVSRKFKNVKNKVKVRKQFLAKKSSYRLK